MFSGIKTKQHIHTHFYHLWDLIFFFCIIFEAYYQKGTSPVIKIFHVLILLVVTHCICKIHQTLLINLVNFIVYEQNFTTANLKKMKEFSASSQKEKRSSELYLFLVNDVYYFFV